MKKLLLFACLIICFDNNTSAQMDSNKNRFDTILIKHDPGMDNKTRHPDSTNERKKKPPVQKVDLSINTNGRRNQPIIN